MIITQTFHAPDRASWRGWLAAHHDSEREIWLVSDKTRLNVPYLEAVEEALCFGWIDGVAKRIDSTRLAQRFTPRRRQSHWTELNKLRARRLIDEGRMTEAGHAALPDLSPEAFHVAPDILAALQAEPETWTHFCAFPETYRRVRVGYIEETRRNPQVFRSRLEHFLKKTRQNKRFGGLR